MDVSVHAGGQPQKSFALGPETGSLTGTWDLLVRLASQGTLRICLSLSPLQLGYKGMPPHPTFYMGAGN